MTEQETEETDDVQVFGQILKTNDEKQIVTGPILVPGKPDRGGDIVSKSNIEEVAHDYLATHRLVDEMHDGIDRPDHAVVESWTAKQPLELGDATVPRGTWLASVKLGDDAWSKVKDGTYSGFSIEGEGRRYYGHEGGD